MTDYRLTPPLAPPIVSRQQKVQKGACWTRTAYVAKRAFDITFVLLLLLPLAPVLAVIALLIKLDSRGPILFVQARVGSQPIWSNGSADWQLVTFNFLKFRSMVVNADSASHQQLIENFIKGNGDGADGSKLECDPRITRIGRLIRATSLDELPQLLNILRGDMSLVGPRPVPVYEAELYEPHHMRRYNTLPGLTGLWQVKGRGRVTFEEMIAMDVEYIEQRSLIYDASLLLHTLPAVLKGDGAS